MNSKVSEEINPKSNPTDHKDVISLLGFTTEKNLSLHDDYRSVESYITKWNLDHKSSTDIEALFKIENNTGLTMRKDFVLSLFEKAKEESSKQKDLASWSYFNKEDISSVKLSIELNKLQVEIIFKRSFTKYSTRKEMMIFLVDSDGKISFSL